MGPANFVLRPPYLRASYEASRFSDLIIFENDDYLVVNKPPFLATLDERVGGAPNLLRMARQQYDDIQAAHRLDRETSGALAFAKTPAAYRHLAMQFEDRQVKKQYHAVVWGTPQLDNQVVERSIETTTRGKARLAYKGKPAETHFTTLETFTRHALMLCEPITGRMHQIRLHLMYLQAPSWATRPMAGRISTCPRSRRSST
jgi:RluA family pseudouridine synthase